MKSDSNQKVKEGDEQVKDWVQFKSDYQSFENSNYFDDSPNSKENKSK